MSPQGLQCILRLSCWVVLVAPDYLALRAGRCVLFAWLGRQVDCPLGWNVQLGRLSRLSIPKMSQEHFPHSRLGGPAVRRGQQFNQTSLSLLLQLLLNPPLPPPPSGNEKVVNSWLLSCVSPLGRYDFLDRLAQQYGGDSSAALLPNIVFSLALARWYQEQGEAGFVVQNLDCFVLVWLSSRWPWLAGTRSKATATHRLPCTRR